MTKFLPALLLISLISGPAKGHIHQEALLQKTRQMVIAGAREVFSGRYSAGGNHFTDALKLSKNGSIYTLILLTARLTGSDSSALRLCMNDPHLARRDHAFRYWCGRTYFDFGYQKSGLKLVKLAISLGGKLDHYVATAAVMAQKLGKTQEAQQLLKGLLKSDPWLLRTWLFPTHLAGIIQTVEELFSGFLYKGQLYHNLAVFAWKAKLPDMADHYLIKAWNNYKTIPPSLHELKVQIVKVFDIRSKTMGILKKSLARHPAHVPLLFEKANQLYSKGYISRSLAILTRLIKADPTSLPILTRLGLLNIEMGKVKTGYRYLSYAKTRNAVSAEYHYAWGMYWQRKGQFKSALKAFTEASNKNPTNLKYFTAYMAVLRVTGNKKALALSQKRLTSVKTLSQELTKAKSAYNKRFSALINAYATVKAGGTPSWPAVCSAQCLALKAYRAMRQGKAAALGPITARLARPALLRGGSPQNTLLQKVQLPSGKTLMAYHFFYSLRPSTL